MTSTWFRLSAETARAEANWLSLRAVEARSNPYASADSNRQAECTWLSLAASARDSAKALEVRAGILELHERSAACAS